MVFLIVQIIFIHFNQLGNNLVWNVMFVEIIQIDFFFLLDEDVDDVLASQKHDLVGLRVVQLAQDDVRVPAPKTFATLLCGAKLKI